MIEVKFHKGISKIYNVSYEEFKEATKEKAPYLNKNGDKKEAYALCPLCENPVKLLGVYAKLAKQNPHARHFKNDITNLAQYDEYTYLQCPYHKENADYVTEFREPEDITALNREILQLAHDYFDKCIYILRKTTGLVISDKLAEEIATDYMLHPGYMTYDITHENVPYIMGLCMTGKNLINRVIEENSPIYEMLKNKKEVELVLLLQEGEHKTAKNLYRITSKTGYLGICFTISRYRYTSSKTAQLREYIKLHIGIPDGKGTYDTYAQKEIEVDPFFFNKLIHSKKAPAPKKELVDIADRILVLR